MAPREPENSAYAKFWGDKQRALWYVMVFSGVVNSNSLNTILTFLLPVPPPLRVSRGGLGNKDPENPKESSCVFKKKKLAIVLNVSAG